MDFFAKTFNVAVNKNPLCKLITNSVSPANFYGVTAGVAGTNVN